jgi:hypothetical protein
MKVVTVATHSERYFPVLQQSCKRHGIDLVVLGWGQKWQGFTWRFKLLSEYLKTCDHNELIVFIDAYDVIALQNHDVIESRFKKIKERTGAKLIIGWETAKSFIIEGFAIYIFGKCNNLRVNCGCYMGYSQDINDIIDKLDFNVQDDQILFSEYCRKDNKAFHVDKNLDIFYVINGQLSGFDIKKEGVTIVDNVLKVNGQTPCFIHGIGATIMDDIILNLGYDNPYPLTMSDSIKYKFKSIIHFQQYVLTLIIISLIACFILLVLIIIFQK